MRSETQTQPRETHGFTLMELLIVLAILALIAVFAVPNLMKLLGGAKSHAAEIQIDNLKSAMNIYRLEVGTIPTTEQGLKALVERPDGVLNWDGPYLEDKASIIDPWKRPYGYEAPGRNGKVFSIFTLGADGQEGGEGENADIRG